MELIQKIGENIKKHRMNKDMSQNALSRDSGVSLSLINWLEAGKQKNVTVNTLERLAKAMGIEFRMLVL